MRALKEEWHARPIVIARSRRRRGNPVPAFARGAGAGSKAPWIATGLAALAMTGWENGVIARAAGGNDGDAPECYDIRS